MDLRTRGAVLGRLFAGYPADPAAGLWLKSDDRVTVTRVGSNWEFQPADGDGRGLMLYPGARVDPRAYACLARRVAERGHLAVIVGMPGGIAFAAPGRADGVCAAHPEVQRWTLAGHSLGGTAAARYVARHPGVVDALVLLGAYSAPGDDLSASPCRCVSLRASEDRVLNASRYEAGRARLPATTQWIELPGGNHAGFGEYGPQAADGHATLPRQQQLDAVVAVLLDTIEAGP